MYIHEHVYKINIIIPILTLIFIIIIISILINKDDLSIDNTDLILNIILPSLMSIIIVIGVAGMAQPSLSDNNITNLRSKDSIVKFTTYYSDVDDVTNAIDKTFNLHYVEGTYDNQYPHKGENVFTQGKNVYTQCLPTFASMPNHQLKVTMLTCNEKTFINQH